MPDMQLSLDELAQKDGKEGRPVYIAYEGKIYDVSQSKLWKTGSHMRRHFSGKDLTTDMGGAPHGPEVLERHPRVGTIRPQSVPEIEQKSFLEPLFKKAPILRRHPHPMTVHFPIVFMLSAVFFTFLYLITGDPSYDATALPRRRRNLYPHRDADRLYILDGQLPWAADAVDQCEDSCFPAHAGRVSCRPGLA
jgi:predicted heme/steroid binding protein